MEIPEEQKRIKDNLAVIRLYLTSKFPDHTITEAAVPSLYHKFTVTNHTQYTRYKLKVSWPRLSDRSNTPEHTRSALDSGNVASGMMQIGDNDYYW
ncbi:MAG: hypothetical protein NDI90_14215 [Nitrospira sp. BO4]|jgi:hypothetical protein|nr:hypothetical protein [Nitrospira sp. BO4]